MLMQYSKKFEIIGTNCINTSFFRDDRGFGGIGYGCLNVETGTEENVVTIFWSTCINAITKKLGNALEKVVLS